MSKQNKGNYQGSLTAAVFIISALLGVVMAALLHDPHNWMFWFFVIWALVYLYLAFCCIDGKKIDRLEEKLGTVLEDLGLAMMFIIPMIGIAYNTYGLITAQKADVTDIAALLILAGIPALFIWLMIKGHLTFNFMKRK